MNRKPLIIIICSVILLIALPQFLPRFYIYMGSLILVTGLLATD